MRLHYYHNDDKTKNIYALNQYDNETLGARMIVVSKPENKPLSKRTRQATHGDLLKECSWWNFQQIEGGMVYKGDPVLCLSLASMIQESCAGFDDECYVQWDDKRGLFVGCGLWGDSLLNYDTAFFWWKKYPYPDASSKLVPFLGQGGDENVSTYSPSVTADSGELPW